ncbi:hypothetical protein CH371_12945 [Leptospira wolffii]|uniref:Uncharacterized protein n=1 Tax=Leptospira wolffii TaxID=409998 RepID=A0A2M9ZA72_9LEPT|nr:hypothetical protein CH371_12945 [Leptospira wolffii]
MKSFREILPIRFETPVTLREEFGNSRNSENLPGGNMILRPIVIVFITTNSVFSREEERF